MRRSIYIAATLALVLAVVAALSGMALGNPLRLLAQLIVLIGLTIGAAVALHRHLL